MEPEFVRERLVRPFASTKKRGLGLGLYQCRRIVEAHGGEIRVDSRPGEGTVFQVVFPGVDLPGSSSGHPTPERSARWRAVPH
jgi:signal transduction histidine kinase